MKLQLQPGSLRLRVAETELAQLLQGRPLRLDLVHGAATLLVLDVRLHDAPRADGARCELRVDDACRWRLMLPASAIAAYARTLPRRDALVLESLPQDEAGPALAVLFEVDVRDSVRVRGAGSGEQRTRP